MGAPAPKLDHGLHIPAVRRVSALAPLKWLILGWRDLMAHPAPSIFYGTLVALAGLLMVLAGVQRPFLLMTAISGYLLVAPLLAAGIYHLTRLRERGVAHPRLRDSVGQFVDDAPAVIHYGIVLALAFLVWERVATVIFALFYGGEIGTIDSFVQDVLLSGDFVAVLLVWCLTGGLLAAVVFAVTVVGIPMVVDRGVDIVTAMVTSVRAARANLPAMLVWAGIIVVMSLLGWATLMMGLLVIMPWLGHATWCAYRDLVDGA